MKAPNEVFPFDHPFIKYPQFASVKYDGFRCLNLCGERFVSPALKDIPNRNLAKHLHNFFEWCRLTRVVTDGELWSPDIPFNELSSIVRSFNKPLPESVHYHIFDLLTEAEWDNDTEPEFRQRMWKYVNIPSFAHVRPVIQQSMQSAEQAKLMFEGIIDANGEGIILRSPVAKYKHNRCTPKEDGMWKFKQFETHDAMIVGVEEQMKLKQGVERTTNEIGRLEREHSQEFYEPAGLVGAFIVNWDGLIFKVKPGKGFDNAWKAAIWRTHVDQGSIVEKHIEFRYMPHGTKDKPRIGSLVRFRPDKD